MQNKGKRHSKCQKKKLNIHQNSICRFENLKETSDVVPANMQLKNNSCWLFTPMTVLFKPLDLVNY